MTLIRGIYTPYKHLFSVSVFIYYILLIQLNFDYKNNNKTIDNYKI